MGELQRKWVSGRGEGGRGWGGFNMPGFLGKKQKVLKGLSLLLI